MFNALKDKLKNWISKNEEEEIIEEVPTKKIVKKKKQKKETTPEPESEKPKEKKSLFSKFKKEKAEEEKPKPKKSFLSKFQKTLDEEKFEELFQELQIILLQNNVAYEAVESIKTSLAEKLIGTNLKDVDLDKELSTAIKSLLINPPNFLDQIKAAIGKRPSESGHSPFVILFAGINGSGKTTTIAKITNYLQKNKLSVCLAAADTFRAAAIQQLEEHANKLKVPIVKKDYGSDPASVGFEAIKYAKKNKIDVVLIDTAGRMQNRDSLMKELEKIERVTKPDMKIFLGESITGNDATEQAKAFNEAIDLTGIILSKADVDEKGGTALSVSHVTNKPILFLGTGQGYKDLEVFNKEKLIKKLGL